MTTPTSFFLEDHGRTLFPLTTNKILVENGSRSIAEYIEKCFDPGEASYNFLPQERVYAAKQNLHLRRTAKLDAVAEFYLYSVIYENRGLFRKPHRAERSNFGYRFEGGSPISATIAYKAFRTAIAKYRKQFAHFLSFDVATYFNSIYHHDLQGWFGRLGASHRQVEQFGTFFRQIGSGRSLDCLPHGLYPTKMIGNDYLRFVDDSFQLRSAQLLRFMDDFYLFSDSQQTINQDFLLIQRMLGEKGLSVNPKKTDFMVPGHVQLQQDIDSVKKTLLDRRRDIIEVGEYDEPPDLVEIEMPSPLSAEELAYLTDLLSRDHIEEEDAELILTTMRSHADEVGSRIEMIIAEFPHLAKSVAIFCANFTDLEMVSSAVLKRVRSAPVLQEFQLFWFGVMIENYLIKTNHASELIEAVYNHPSATRISKAKILEIPELRFGLQEIRDPLLKQSDWLGWAAAVGSRSLPLGERNYKLAYFANGSAFNHLVAAIVQGLP